MKYFAVVRYPKINDSPDLIALLFTNHTELVPVEYDDEVKGATIFGALDDLRRLCHELIQTYDNLEYRIFEWDSAIAQFGVV